MNFSGPVNVTFSPGLFIIKDGVVSENDGSFTGQGVSFFLTGSGASMQLSGQADWHIVAPTDGPLPGFAIFLDPNGPTGLAASSSSLSGGCGLSTSATSLGYRQCIHGCTIPLYIFHCGYLDLCWEWSARHQQRYQQEQGPNSNRAYGPNQRPPRFDPIKIRSVCAVPQLWRSCRGTKASARPHCALQKSRAAYARVGSKPAVTAAQWQRPLRTNKQTYYSAISWCVLNVFLKQTSRNWRRRKQCC